MKSKRIACIAMAGLMAASLAGCGGSDSDNKDTAEATKAIPQRQQEVIQQMTQQLMLRESSHMQTSS